MFRKLDIYCFYFRELIFAQSFPRYWPFFISKLPYLGIKLGTLAKVPRLHIHPLSTQFWLEIELIFALLSAVSKIMVPKVGHILCFYLSRSKLSLFLLYGQRFPRYWPFSLKIAIFGHETWPLAKIPRLHIHPLSTQLVWNWAYFRSMVSGFQDNGRFSKLPYIWA